MSFELHMFILLKRDITIVIDPCGWQESIQISFGHGVWWFVVFLLLKVHLLQDCILEIEMKQQYSLNVLLFSSAVD